ncbi:hypothetical protein IPM62_00180 [Candidatus Woesebacteria bacterium]|nr:MAG: hypothetical protein IPM62_00180 [Candidatus Woesebacteria bacterium]
MKFPLSFNPIDYRRTVVIIGKIPDANYGGANSVYELWERETSNAESLKKSFRFNKWTFQKDEVFHNLNHDFDKFVDHESSSHEDRKNGIHHVIGINDLSRWSGNGVIHYLFAEARPKKLIVVVEEINVKEIKQSITDNMFANLGCLIIGHLSLDERVYLKNTFAGEDKKLNDLFELGDDEWAMYFPYAYHENGREGLYVYSGLCEKYHL